MAVSIVKCLTADVYLLILSVLLRPIYAEIIAGSSTGGDTPHRRFEYKYSFKGPHLSQSDGSVPFWVHTGSKFMSASQAGCSVTVMSPMLVKRVNFISGLLPFEQLNVSRKKSVLFDAVFGIFSISHFIREDSIGPLDSKLICKSQINCHGFGVWCGIESGESAHVNWLLHQIQSTRLCQLLVTQEGMQSRLREDPYTQDISRHPAVCFQPCFIQCKHTRSRGGNLSSKQLDQQQLTLGPRSHHFQHFKMGVSFSVNKVMKALATAVKRELWKFAAVSLHVVQRPVIYLCFSFKLIV